MKRLLTLICIVVACSPLLYGFDFIVKQSTNTAFPVVLVDSADGYTPETEKKAADTTITYCNIVDANATSSYADTDTSWKEVGDGTGEYRLIMGATEFTTVGKRYLVKVVVSGCRTYRFTAFTIAGDPGDLATCDGVWDEVLTAATHNVPSSAGRRLRTISGDTTAIWTGTAVSGTVNTVVLDATASTARDNVYLPCIITKVSVDAGTVESRNGIAYSASTRTMTVAPNWLVTPVAKDTLTVNISTGSEYAWEGLATDANDYSVTLGTTASSEPNIYAGHWIKFESGTGAPATYTCTYYDGTNRKAYSDGWDTNPDTTTVVAIIPSGGAMVDTSGGGLGNVNVTMWNGVGVGDLLTGDEVAELGQEKMDANSVDLDAILAMLPYGVDTLEANIRGALNKDLYQLFVDLNDVKKDVNSIALGEVEIVVDANDLWNSEVQIHGRTWTLKTLLYAILGKRSR